MTDAPHVAFAWRLSSARAAAGENCCASGGAGRSDSCPQAGPSQPSSHTHVPLFPDGSPFSEQGGGSRAPAACSGENASATGTTTRSSSSSSRSSRAPAPTRPARRSITYGPRRGDDTSHEQLSLQQ